jgi:SAM-dependent methyltransferase
MRWKVPFTFFRTVALLVPAIRRLSNSRDQLLAERDALRAERDALLVKVDALLVEKELGNSGSMNRDMKATKSNLACWKKMQEEGYFEHHSWYGEMHNGLELFGTDLDLINHYIKLTQDMKVVVIGCGYGRESVLIAPHVSHVFGIDVSRIILRKAEEFVEQHGIKNFTPVLAERWVLDIPSSIDFVYEIVVFQHLTKDLVRQYIAGLAEKLSPTGKYLCQFLEDRVGSNDAELRVHEPRVTWTHGEIEELIGECGLTKFAIDEEAVSDGAKWHWACFGKP